MYLCCDSSTKYSENNVNKLLLTNNNKHVTINKRFEK